MSCARVMRVPCKIGVNSRVVSWHRPCIREGHGALTQPDESENAEEKRRGVMGSRVPRDGDGGSLRAYRESLSGLHALDREVERDLARRWGKGDKRAGEKIIEACLPFVVSI